MNSVKIRYAPSLQGLEKRINETLEQLCGRNCKIIDIRVSFEVGLYYAVIHYKGGADAD